MDYMDNDQKVYVDVIEKRRKDGRILPIFVLWEDGIRYKIDKILDLRRAASLKAGGVGLRYTVRVGGRETYLYLEDDKVDAKWFVERK